MDQAIKLIQVLAALWNFILSKENKDDEDEDDNNDDKIAPVLGGDIVLDDDAPPAPAGILPTHQNICNLYYQHLRGVV